jgi:hypothetical protein
MKRLAIAALFVAAAGAVGLFRHGGSTGTAAPSRGATEATAALPRFARGSAEEPAPPVGTEPALTAPHSPFLVKAPAPAAEPPGTTPPSPAPEPVVVVLRRYRDEICACRDLACAEAVGEKHAAAAAAAEHRSTDALGLAELRKSVNDCLGKLATRPASGR